MIEQNQINCPKCGTSIDVNTLITHQLEKDIKSKYDAELIQERQKVLDQIELIRKEKNEFELKKKRENELFQEKLDEKIKEERRLIEEKIKTKISE